jgi:uncharacterized protein (TIGR03067 family)
MKKRVELLVFISALLCAATPKATAEEPASELEGDWWVVAVTMDGIKAQDEIARQLKLIVHGNKLMLKPGLALDGNGKVEPGNTAGEEAIFTVDPAKSPKHINLSFGSGTNKDAMKGIYAVEKGELKICFSPKARPKDFANAVDSGQTLLVAKRDKP